MANYFEVINNNDSITIDDKNARMVKTRTWTIAPGYTELEEAYFWGLRGYIPDQYLMGSLCYDTVDLQDNESFVAIRAKEKHENVAILGGFVSPKKYMVLLMGCRNNVNTHENDYLLDVYGTIPTNDTVNGNAGLQIFNENGKKIFDNNYYCMDVVGTYSIVDKKMESFVDAINTYGIGGNYNNNSIVINTCINKPYRHPRTGGQLWASILYGVVFSDPIRLEKRVCAILTFLNHGGTNTPHGMSHNTSGIILDTTNIS